MKVPSTKSNNIILTGEEIEVAESSPPHHHSNKRRTTIGVFGLVVLGLSSTFVYLLVTALEQLGGTRGTIRGTEDDTETGDINDRAKVSGGHRSNIDSIITSSESFSSAKRKIVAVQNDVIIINKYDDNDDDKEILSGVPTEMPASVPNNNEGTTVAPTDVGDDEEGTPSLPPTGMPINTPSIAPMDDQEEQESSRPTTMPSGIPSICFEPNISESTTRKRSPSTTRQLQLVETDGPTTTTTPEPTTTAPTTDFPSEEPLPPQPVRTTPEPTFALPPDRPLEKPSVCFEIENNNDDNDNDNDNDNNEPTAPPIRIEPTQPPTMIKPSFLDVNNYANIAKTVQRPGNVRTSNTDELPVGRSPLRKNAWNHFV